MLGGIVQRLTLLNHLQLDEVQRFVRELESEDISEQSITSERNGIEETTLGFDEVPPLKDWPHAPTHRLNGKGTFIVTAGTLHKEHYFQAAERLDFLERDLFAKAKQYLSFSATGHVKLP